MMRLKEYLEQDKTYIIAEMSGNHAGSFDHAIEIVHAAKLAGADCLKIQTYTADTLTIDCDNDEFISKGGLWDGYKAYDLYKYAMTPWEWQKAIKDECDKVGIDFLSTPFDYSSVNFLESIGIEAYKIASSEFVDLPLIRYVASKHKPIIISCGYGSEKEIAEAIEAIESQDNHDYVLLRCSAEYPANFDRLNLSLIPDMKEKFKCPVGLSDHSFGSIASIVGVSLGACVIEKHFCVSREIKSADTGFSLDYNDFVQLVKDIRDTEKLIGKPVYEGIEGKHQVRSLYVVKDIKAGEKLTAENVRSIRPGKGLLPKYYDEVIGKTATTDLPFGKPLEFKDLK